MPKLEYGSYLRLFPICATYHPRQYILTQSSAEARPNALFVKGRCITVSRPEQRPKLCEFRMGISAVRISFILLQVDSMIPRQRLFSTPAQDRACLAHRVALVLTHLQTVPCAKRTTVLVISIAAAAASVRTGEPPSVSKRTAQNQANVRSSFLTCILVRQCGDRSFSPYFFEEATLTCQIVHSVEVDEAIPQSLTWSSGKFSLPDCITSWRRIRRKDTTATM